MESNLKLKVHNWVKNKAKNDNTEINYNFRDYSPNPGLFFILYCERE